MTFNSWCMPLHPLVLYWILQPPCIPEKHSSNSLPTKLQPSLLWSTLNSQNWHNTYTSTSKPNTHHLCAARTDSSQLSKPHSNPATGNTARSLLEDALYPTQKHRVGAQLNSEASSTDTYSSCTEKYGTSAFMTISTPNSQAHSRMFKQFLLYFH